LLYDLALRRGEVVALDVEDLEMVGDPPRPGCVWVMGKGRGDKQRLTLPDGRSWP
jgi:site-specific recombinase XerC